MMDSGFGALHSSGTYVQDVPELPRTLGWDGQRNCSHLEWDAWDMSGMSLGFPGLRDGMDSGIGALHSGTLGTCPGLPETLGWDCSHLERDAWDMSWVSRDSGMGWTVGLEPSGVGHTGHVWDVPGLPTTLGKYGQWVWNSPQQWDTLDMSRMFLSFPGLLGWDGQRNCSHLEWDAWDMSGMSLGFLGLWDGMDSGIGAI